MANPPFNVDGVDKDKFAKDQRFPFGLPTPDNANYIWIELFYAALASKGRAGFVMANSAGDARGSELEIRKKLIESGAVDVIVAVGPNFFYTVTLPCTLWFFDKRKVKGPRVNENVSSSTLVVSSNRSTAPIAILRPRKLNSSPTSCAFGAAAKFSCPKALRGISRRIFRKANMLMCLASATARRGRKLKPKAGALIRAATSELLQAYPMRWTSARGLKNCKEN